MVYCLPADVKTYMGGFTDADASVDTELTDLIARVQVAIDRFCLRRFEAGADTTQYYHALDDVGIGSRQVKEARTWDEADDLRTLYLDDDLCQITTITNGDGVVVGPTQYVTLPRNRTPWYAIRLKLNSNIVWTWDDTPEDAISILGRHAFSVTVPEDVKLYAIRLTAYIFKLAENYDPAMDRAQRSPDGVLLLPSMWPSDVRAGLVALRRS